MTCIEILVRNYIYLVICIKQSALNLVFYCLGVGTDTTSKVFTGE